MSAKLPLGLILAAALSCLLFAIACQQATTPTNQSTMNAADSKSWDSHVNEFIEAYFVAHPDFAVRAGRHEFDGKLLTGAQKDWPEKPGAYMLRKISWPPLGIPL